MKKIFAEIGFGNDTFLSTEIEENNKEHRVGKFLIPKKLKDFYFRACFFKKNLIISTRDGIKLKSRDKNNFKLLFGLGGFE